MRDSHELYEIASKYRGDFLNEVSWMEKFLDAYIAKHFVGDDKTKETDMHLLFLGDSRVTMENKRQIFHFLAEKYDLEWYKSYQPVIFRDYKKGIIPMNKELVDIIELRNVLAHRIVDTTKEGRENDEVISFLTYKNDVSKITLSYNDFAGYIFAIKSITNHLYRRFK